MKNFQQKDPYLLLSLINTTLRDECNSLEDLGKKYDVLIDTLIEKMKAIDYVYDKVTNQFK